MERNLNRGLSLTSEQSYFRGNYNLAPRQICRDGHYHIQLVMVSVHLGFDPSKGAIQSANRYWDRDIPALVCRSHSAATTFKVNSHPFVGLSVNAMHDDEIV
ncbi:hypothetical protein EMIT0P12_30566 [Pseudomonas sp. IT-P12]